MISGFNTDIHYEGVTYHVQTEDKGLATPLILSLVYDRGTILASKRSPYDDLLDDNFDEKILTERLQKQHKLICAAIRAGRLEDLIRMTMKESASRQKGLVAQKNVKSVVEKKETELPPPANTAETAAMPSNINGEPKSAEYSPHKSSEQIQKPAETAFEPSTEEVIWDIPINIIEEPAAEFIETVEEEAILPAEAVEIISELARNDPDDDKLRIELLNETVFKGGEHKTISLIVRRGNGEKGLSGAHILVKIIGSSFRPLIFHAKTDSNGVAIVHLQLPQFKTGRAAILVRAMSEGEEIELRRVILQR